ncbi:nucleoside diphosphate kinase regulator [Massilia cavernae]|uniref:Nucleoside diphosphate kinase regulator n=1 Tax=Massilia cavernae TaxID=2320864 RepID=A0A418XXR2_9BURK|nr:nucleoside diphosphate kinase regulator [Massilia cavernae]RJG17740.1 nucleoside diphosphate kinase regulator [Massilia cavernae]
MNNLKPTIIVSALDMERLEALLDSLPSAQAGCRDALLDELARAEVVPSGQVPPGVVTMNSTVRFAIDSLEGSHTLTLAYPKDMDGTEGRVSVLTPVGSALLGLSEGDSIDWPRPDGAPLRLTVSEVLYQPERAGEPHR